MLKLLIMLFCPLVILSFFSGCTPKTVYVDKIKIVKEKVLVRCKTERPKECNWSTGSVTEVAPKLLECIIEQKKLLEKCRGK